MALVNAMPLADPSGRARNILLKLAGGLPVTVIALTALFWWMVFYPGLLSNDSVCQYRQAATGEYSNIRPPVMSIILAGVLHIGGNIQHVMLGQCLAVLFGVYALSLAALRWWVPTLGKVATRYAALAVVAILLLPISPLPFYLMTFWTDVWVMAPCCWLGALWFQMMRRENETLRCSYALKLGLFLGLSVLVVLVRHNSVVLLPVVSGLLLLLVRRVAPWKLALVVLLAPTLLYETVHHGIERAFKVEQVPLHRLVFAHELVGLCVRYPEVKAELPFTAGKLTENYHQVYYAGYGNLYGPYLVSSFYEYPEQIHEDYEKALLHHPFQMARVKFENFRCHFVKNPCLRFHPELDANEFGLTLNSQYAGLRDWQTQTLWNAFERRTVRWFFTRHLVWITVGTLALAALLVRGGFKGGRRWYIGALALLIPLGYYLSFLLASLTAEFRYMYPSDVFLQAVVLGCVLGSLFLGVKRTLSAAAA